MRLGPEACIAVQTFKCRNGNKRTDKKLQHFFLVNLVCTFEKPKMHNYPSDLINF